MEGNAMVRYMNLGPLIDRDIVPGRIGITIPIGRNDMDPAVIENRFRAARGRSDYHVVYTIQRTARSSAK